ncbi:MAG: BadF/BadG/BcrA/BcrD ATPase family protein [Shimia sp.]|uniref:BadF/BadG/BcrA/BcrD ATPase family protein n=1 Tax=Shimia sp. TaxID=1954381 RepID=UPI00405901E1
MTKNHTIPVLAIDGGGTRCRIALQNGENLTQIKAGSANVSTDFEAAIREILAGLATLSKETGVATQTLCAMPTYAGLAGVTGQKIASRVAAALPFQTIKVEDDRPSALRGAVGAGDGFVVHCGTGSFVAAQLKGRVHLAGGWGAVLGDPSSAQWVGRQSLARTLDVSDGLRQSSDLSKALMDRFDGTAGIVAFAATASPADFGALAPAVSKRAANGDPMATAIMQDAMDRMATTLRKLGWQDGVPICLTGGIGPLYAPYMPSDMQACLAEKLGEPMAGAVSLAKDFSKEITDEHH